jgi:predicted nucleic acid-binding protein
VPPVLIDTNVLVYASDPAEETRQDQALRILKHLETTQSGRLSAQCLAEFVHVTTRPKRALYSRAEAALQVDYLVRAFPVFDLTPLIVLEAARGARDHDMAYYDAQIWASARLNQVTVIFSEHFAEAFSNGQMLEGVRFVNPFAEGFRLEDWAYNPVV